MKHRLLVAFASYVAYLINRELYHALDFQKVQIFVLLEERQPGKRLLLNDSQRRRLARKAKKLSAEMLERTSLTHAPTTILGWYRKLIAQKYTAPHRKPGRPQIYHEIVKLVLRLREENPRWGAKRICDVINSLDIEVSRTSVRNILVRHGYDPEPDATPTWKLFLKSHFDVITACDFFSVEIATPKGLIRYMVLFAIELSTRRVEILGVKCDPDGAWMEQIARNITDCENGFLNNKKYLIHDRDSLFTQNFASILKSAGVECIKLPPKSPNLNSFAERFVRTIKEEAFNHLILTSESQLRYVLKEFDSVASLPAT